MLHLLLWSSLFVGPSPAAQPSAPAAPAAPKPTVTVDPAISVAPATNGPVVRGPGATAALPYALGRVVNGWMQQSINGDGVTATFSIPSDMVPAFGFVPVRISTDNTTARELRWRMNLLIGNSSPMGPSEGEMERTLVVPPGGSERWIYVPTAGSGSSVGYRGYFTAYGNFNVTLTGTALGTSRLSFGSSNGRGNRMVPWAVSSKLENAVRKRIATLTTTTPPAGRPPLPIRRARGGPASAAPAPAPATPTTFPLVPGAPNLTAFDLSQSFGDARIFQPFARFVMGLEDYAVLNPATKAALRNWVALGGWLYLSPDQPGAVAKQDVLGVGRIITLARPLSDDGDDAQGLFAESGLFDLTPAVPNVGDLSLQAGELPGKVPRAKRVGDWLIYFFIGFAALVAPINLLVIAPVKRRHWLFFTVPGISALAVVALTVAIFTQDGVVGEGARRALVVLLPGDNAAAVFQDQISRTGLLFRTTFTLPEDTVCAEIAADDFNFNPGRNLQYDRQDGVASGDWFRGRTRQAQHLRRLVPTRARLEQVGQAPDGAPIVQSSIGVVLRSLVYFDAAGIAWTAEQIPLGQAVTLKRLADPDAARMRLAIFGSSASVHFKQLVQGATAITTPNRFFAFADPGELAPIPTLASINWKESQTLIAGFLVGATNAGGTR